MPSSNTISPSSFTSSFAASHCAGDLPSISCSPSSPQYRFIASATVAVPCPSNWNGVQGTIASKSSSGADLTRRRGIRGGDAGYIEYPSHQY
ncbi:hypothetical protein [Nonomuraea jabiensis]|uniref:hypothetical protein n=1 Tax=Nonomuraea jabiensis TaxID=882448 RepID=UPI003D71FCC1